MKKFSIGTLVATAIAVSGIVATTIPAQAYAQHHHARVVEHRMMHHAKMVHHRMVHHAKMVHHHMVVHHMEHHMEHHH